MRSRTFESFAGTAAIAGALGSLGYAVAFVTLLRNAADAAETLSDLVLLLGGILTAAVLVAVYGRVREVDPGFATWGLALGLVGTIGSAIHGGYGLALRANRPTVPLGNLPNAVDPRGLATFGFTALALLIFSYLILRGGVFPRGVGNVGYLAGVLLVGVYLGRLIVLNPKSPGLLAAAALSGFIVNPVWFIWIGIELRRGAAAAGSTTRPPPDLPPSGAT